MRRPWVIGHRGAPAEAPENTLASFEAAIDAGVDGVECDVHLSRDGVVMVLHDATLDRTTSLRGPIADYDAATLEAAGVPTLAAVLERTRNVLTMVELKGGSDIHRAAVDVVHQAAAAPSVMFFDFDYDRLAELRALAPGATLVALSPDPIVKPSWANAVGLHYPVVTEAPRSHSLFAWTVPPGPEVERLISLGVDAIITDDPRSVIAQLDRIFVS